MHFDLHCARAAHVGQAERHEVVDYPGLVAGRWGGRGRHVKEYHQRCRAACMCAESGARWSSAVPVRWQCKKERVETCPSCRKAQGRLPVADSVPIDSLVWVNQRWKRADGVHGHHEDDAHDVALHRQTNRLVSCSVGARCVCCASAATHWLDPETGLQHRRRT